LARRDAIGRLGHDPRTGGQVAAQEHGPAVAVDGHSFLTIDMKHKVASAEIDDWDYLMSISGAILASTAPT
jgi:hypothetical protein